MNQSNDDAQQNELEPPFWWMVVPTAIAVGGTLIFLVAFFLR